MTKTGNGNGHAHAYDSKRRQTARFGCTTPTTTVVWACSMSLSVSFLGSNLNDSCQCRTVQPTPAQNKRRLTANDQEWRTATKNNNKRQTTTNDKRRGEDRTTGRRGTGDRGYTAAPNDTTTRPSLTSLLVGWIADGTTTTPMPTHATTPYHPPPSLMGHSSAK
jgi:hypothetical protein